MMDHGSQFWDYMVSLLPVKKGLSSKAASLAE